MTTPNANQCISCAYPLDRDRDVLSVLARVKQMMEHVGFGVDRVLVEDSQTPGRMSVTLELRPTSPSSPKKRERSPEHSSEPTAKRPCKLCASSCCSTNSLCRANACTHKGEEESRPVPASPDHHHHHHHHHHKHHRHQGLPPKPVTLPPVVPEPTAEAAVVVAEAAAQAGVADSEIRARDPRQEWSANIGVERVGVSEFTLGKRVVGRTSSVTREEEKPSKSKEELRPPPELVCRPCGINFENELELRKHQFGLHKDEKIVTRTSEGRFLCLMHSCAQSFVRRHVMERHFKTVHMMVREFPCTSCDKSFADSSTREAHRSAVHEKRKPWVCDQCSSCFTQSSSLGKHRRRFHQETVVTNTQKQ